MKIAILGFGREGQAVLQFIRKSPQYKKAEIFVCDHNAKLQIDANTANIKLRLGKNYLKNLEGFNIVFRSPGVPYNLPEIQKAIKKGVKFSSATKLFFDNFKGKIIGITGTKGKGTTATLLYKILKANDKKVYIAGNMGIPPFKILRKADKDSIAVLELSSFQLQDMEKSPHVAVVLDIFPDHMDAHKNFPEYISAKANIARFQRKNDKIFYFNDNKNCRWIASKSRARKISVRVHSGHSNAFGFSGRDLKILGFHNFKNAVMAATVAKSLGWPKEKIIKTIRNFKGNEHRLELVRKIKDVSFYNDSASTNPQTATAAVKSFTGPKILIAGGKDKRLDYSPLAKTLKNSNTKLVVLFGENKNKIKKALARIKNNELRIKEIKDLKSVVNLAYQTAKRLQQLEHYNNTTIIFSPGAASFDMFKNYAERGKKFKEFVRKLK